MRTGGDAQTKKKMNIVHPFEPIADEVMRRGNFQNYQTEPDTND
jgi:hypothetical protein